MTILTTGTADYPWRPDSTFFAPTDAVPSALLLQTTTVAGSIEGDTPSVRVAFVKDAESADYVAEGTPIESDEPDLDEVVLNAKRITRLVTLSTQQYRQTETATQVSQSVARDLVQKADNAFLGDSLSDPSTGLLNVDGVIDGGEVVDNLDVLVDLIAELENNGAQPSAIIVDPLTWASLRKLKKGGDEINASLLGAGVTDARPLLLSLPVLRSRWLPAGTGLVADRSQIVSAVGPVEVAVSEHAAFASHAVQMRATWSVGWTVVRPDRLGKFTVEGDLGS
ncbi:major capsid protein [Mycolicibacter nonchromogenicus]|uniref:Major capsid protein n=1 Tax=Mycolicibacter nonchromogenicus TaxID=1782 RepID=A0A1X1ZK12_MYCNO|nr:phage major capsid protein [Mycolicibacter nonchromogenicus]ORW23670.1 major capsid protein [Mycolicibacter nonchromogenicus]